MPDPRPIGIFDSGVGGLTVVRSVIDRSPRESVIYIGDSARSPYGPRSIQEIRGFAVEIARELVVRDVKMLVVACNSVEVAAIVEVAEAAQVPVVGVVDPGARAAVAASRSGEIGVIGTVATIASGAYPRAVRELDPTATLHAVSCPDFFEFIEHGALDDPLLAEAAEGYLAPLREAGVDTLILGCTHYPLIADLIQEVMGPGVTLVSSATETAHDVAMTLERAGLEADQAASAEAVFYCTGDPQQFSAVADRFMGRPVGVTSIALAGVVD